MLLWGGANVLAQALLNIKKSRLEDELAKFAAKLRNYAISDQDDSGPWIRIHFPKVFYIASTHGCKILHFVDFLKSVLNILYPHRLSFQFFFSLAISEIQCTGDSNFSRECIWPRCMDRNVRRVLLQFQSGWTRYKPRDEGVDSKVHSDWTLWSGVGSAIPRFTFVNSHFGKF